MPTQALTLPVDISWQRLAFSADMIDTDFNAVSLPPKWRSSLCIFYHVVPQEQTVEAYPGARIVYLRVSCSITGFNPNEELRNAVNLDRVGDRLDDLQQSTWDAIQAAGWAGKYYACLGAILQIAVYPHTSDSNLPIDDFPFIIDFEPKKREMYETRTETGEVLSGSSDKLNVQKGTTNTDSTEQSDILTGVSVSAGGLSFGGSTSVTGEWGTRNKTGTQTVDTRTTDTSRERRETLSASTTINQMYQLFNAYHLGMNRALFVIAPRPHIVSRGTTPEDRQIDFNLIDGLRKLEGPQDVMAILYVPASFHGLCLQANLDTGHNIPDPVEPGAYSLVVTRRVVRTCATFTDSGSLQPSPIPLPPSPFPNVSFEDRFKTQLLSLQDPSVVPDGTKRSRIADEFNHFLRQNIAQRMLDGYTAGNYPLRPFTRTETFKILLQATLRESRLSLARLVELKYLSQSDANVLAHAKVHTAGDIFTPGLENSPDVSGIDLIKIRNGLTSGALKALDVTP